MGIMRSMGTITLCFDLARTRNKIIAYNIHKVYPQTLRRHRPPTGIISDIGIRNILSDPASKGDKLNEVTKEDLIKRSV